METQFLYRPQKGSLLESLKQQKNFKTIDEMFNYVVNEWGGVFAREDLSLSENMGDDERINWLDVKMVLTSRIGEQKYDIPQCVGWCAYRFIENGISDLKPCPFCGGIAEYHENVPYIDYCQQGEFYVSCTICGARTEKIILRPYIFGDNGNIEYNRKRICDLWNKRINKNLENKEKE